MPAARFAGWPPSAAVEFSREDIRCHALGRTCDAQQTQALIDALVKSGWCKEAPQDGKRRRQAGAPVDGQSEAELMFDLPYRKSRNYRKFSRATPSFNRTT